MVKMGNWVWEGTSLETKPGRAEGALPGHIFKELDTGESYTLVIVNGVDTWLFINLGLSFIKATKSGIVTTDENGTFSVTFETPFISADYGVQLTCISGSDLVVATFANVTEDGFDIQTLDKNGHVVSDVDVAWLATRHYDP